MKNVYSLLIGVILILVASGCSIFQTKIDPSEQHSTDSGFSFKFPMSGDWYPGQSSKGHFMVGQKPLNDGSTKLAIVRHGPIWTPGGKSMTNKELLDGFKKDIEKEAQGGRVDKIKSEFIQKKYKNADCLFFNQTGEDNPSQGPMSMTNDGMICLHPKRKYQFIWMAMSERRPVSRPASDTLVDDRKYFFDSLEFVD
jgi:hypothetical protein